MRAGIDLGTTYSLIARVHVDGRPILMPDVQDRATFHTPSVVHVGADGAFVGQIVESLLEQRPDLPVMRFFKRQFGGREPLLFDDQGTPWYPETLAALVLKKLRYDAESFTSEPLEGTVITVPAHFNDLQRKSVLAAAALADVQVLGLLEEPVAAAMHHGITSKAQEQLVLVYDLGGGTFDVSIVSLDARGVYVLAKDGSTSIGGKEFDERIGEIVLAQFESATGQSPALSARSLLELRRVSEHLKIMLSMAPPGGGITETVLLGTQAVRVAISRAAFERAVMPLVHETERLTRRCVESAGLKPQDINTVLLVGGSSFVPLVQERVCALFAREQQRVMYHEPMKAVAFGAALEALRRSGEASGLALPAEFRGVTGYHLGIRALDPSTGRPVVDAVIRKNLPLPARATRVYYTTSASQQRMVLEVVQFIESPQDAVSLGQLIVGPFLAPETNYPIQVALETGDDGTVAVTATDPRTGAELRSSFGQQREDGLGHLAVQRQLVRSTIVNSM